MRMNLFGGAILEICHANYENCLGGLVLLEFEPHLEPQSAGLHSCDRQGHFHPANCQQLCLLYSSLTCLRETSRSMLRCSDDMT